MPRAPSPLAATAPLPFPSPPRAAKHAHLRRLRVSGGYLDGVDIRFASGGNVILGEHGTGKSTVVALLRYVLNLPVPPVRRDEHRALLAANLGSGRAYVTLATAHGTEYELSRAGGEAGPRVEAGGESAPTAQAILAMVPLRLIGHGELDLLATDGLARLDLLSRFARDEIDRIGGELAKVRRELDDGGPALWRLEREIADLDKKHKTLPAERARLDALKKAAGGDPGALDAANRAKAQRERERLVLDAAERELSWLRGEVGVFAATAVRRLGQVPDAAAEGGPNAAPIAEVSGELARISADLEAFASRIAAECDQARRILEKNQRALVGKHAPEDDAYRALLAKHEGDAGRAFERLTLEKSVAALERTRDEHAARVRERDRVVAARDRLRARQRALVQEMLDTLDRAAQHVTTALGGRVQVAVAPEAERSAYRALLGEILKGKRFDKDDLDTITKSFSPEDLFAQAMRGDSALLAEKLESAATAARLVEALRETERVYELETVDVPHIPAVSMSHGAVAKASETLSSGQRKEAFFSLMLLDRSALVVDQPEDDVGNKYLAGSLCEMFAAVQDEMQFVFVTHDGNIPILGKAQRMFQFESDGKRAWIAAWGPPGEVRAPMEDNFEGGRGAFVARKDFYGV